MTDFDTGTSYGNRHNAFTEHVKRLLPVVQGGASLCSVETRVAARLQYQSDEPSQNTRTRSKADLLKLGLQQFIKYLCELSEPSHHTPTQVTYTEHITITPSPTVLGFFGGFLVCRLHATGLSPVWRR